MALKGRAMTPAIPYFYLFIFLKPNTVKVPTRDEARSKGQKVGISNVFVGGGGGGSGTSEILS